MEKKFGIDGTRYLLLSFGNFGEDIDINWEKLTEKTNIILSDLQEELEVDKMLSKLTMGPEITQDCCLVRRAQEEKVSQMGGGSFTEVTFLFFSFRGSILASPQRYSEEFFMLLRLIEGTVKR